MFVRGVLLLVGSSLGGCIDLVGVCGRRGVFCLEEWCCYVMYMIGLFQYMLFIDW